MDEYCNRAGAERIARRIRDYWRARGRKASLRVVPVGDMYIVRSDMINGLPRER